MTDEET